MTTMPMGTFSTSVEQRKLEASGSGPGDDGGGCQSAGCNDPPSDGGDASGSNSGAGDSGSVGENDGDEPEPLGSCRQESCPFWQKQVHLKNSDGSCEDRCVVFAFLYQLQGWRCGECPTNDDHQGTKEGGFETSLDLRNVPEKYKSAFVAAANKWTSVIKGDAPDVEPGFFMRLFSKCDLPTVIDDLFICIQVVPIDGPGGILGTAMGEFSRPGNGLPLTGSMRFDIDDVEGLMRNNRLDSVVLHEMGHIVRIDTRAFVGCATISSMLTC